MRYLSVCSGIEAATVAWHPIGWTPVAFAEVDPFPCDVLKHHYPEVPNWGDMTKFQEWPDADVDVLVGGTPCQSFSVAGLRKGLADPRGNLTLTYLAIAARYRPRWLVWENVPGVLSDRSGAFGSLLCGMAELGYGWSYRVLDAQYFGLAQRRRRVFVVGSARGWARAAAVLLERESLRGDPAPRRRARQDAAAGTLRSTDGGSDVDHARGGHLIAKAFGGNNTAGPIQVATACNAHGGPMGRMDFESETFVVNAVDDRQPDVTSIYTGDGVTADPITASEADTYTQEGKNFRLHNCVAMAFDTTQITSPGNYSNPQPGDPCHPLAAGAHPPAVTFQSSQSGVRSGDVHATLDSNNGSRRHNGVVQSMQVRRLTPRECERLQGFPDDYTVPWRVRKTTADGPRYKALGNSMAVPVMEWVGRRIENVERIEKEMA